MKNARFSIFSALLLRTLSCATTIQILSAELTAKSVTVIANGEVVHQNLERAAEAAQ